VDSSAGGAAPSSPPLQRVHLLPGQVRRFPVEYTSRLSIKYDYHMKYYSGKFSTYRLDRTTVTVGALRMLAMSTSPASAGASSCASVAAAPSAASSAAAAAGSVLPLAAGGWRYICAKSSSTVGVGLRLPVASPTVSHSSSSPCSTGSVGGNSCKQGNFFINK
jgi:hypothetical protein